MNYLNYLSSVQCTDRGSTMAGETVQVSYGAETEDEAKAEARAETDEVTFGSLVCMYGYQCVQ